MTWQLTMQQDDDEYDDIDFLGNDYDHNNGPCSYDDNEDLNRYYADDDEGDPQHMGSRGNNLANDGILSGGNYPGSPFALSSWLGSNRSNAAGKNK